MLGYICLTTIFVYIYIHWFACFAKTKAGELVAMKVYLLERTKEQKNKNKNKNNKNNNNDNNSNNSNNNNNNNKKTTTTTTTATSTATATATATTTTTPPTPTPTPNNVVRVIAEESSMFVCHVLDGGM